MDPVLMIMIAIALPLFFGMLLLGPVYGGICISLYLFYGEKIKEHFYDPVYILDLFGSVYDYWRLNIDVLDWVDFVLPVFGPFVVGILLGLYWSYLFVRYIKNIFHV